MSRPIPPPLDLSDDSTLPNFVPAPCQVACPIGTDAPSYIGYIWEEDFEGALEAITSTNPFSAVCGRVCDAPCEPACRRTDSDGPIAIRNLKRFVMDKLGPGFHLPEAPVTQSASIGIVGSGPAGMTAAQDLAEAGYEVHIYEMTDRLGGTMVWGIPAFRLPVGVIEEDINRILGHCPGIKVHLNCELGKDVTLDELKEKHGAVLLAIGAWWGKDMGIPGSNVDEFVDGVTYLRRINGGARPTMPSSVVVIGGGDVSMDACRVAKRLPDCENVKVIYRRGADQIPARRDELEGAIKEGIEFLYNVQPTQCRKEGDELVLTCVRTVPGDIGDQRSMPEFEAGSEHEIRCGLAIAAVGQYSACEELDQKMLMAGSKVETSEETMRTPDPQVFAAGDGAFGPSTLVIAMYHGHRAAYYMKAFLEERDDPPPYRTPYRTRQVPVSQDPEWELFHRREQPFHGLGKNPVAFPEIESPYTLQKAKEEAARCYRCDCENGTQEYSVGNREDIFVMARTKANDACGLKAMLKKRLENRANPFPEDRPAVIDDIHFLPANLSRLVIDPYREACRTDSTIGDLSLRSPFLVCGFDEAPEQVREALDRAIAAQGCAYLGRHPVGGESDWIQLDSVSADQDPRAAGFVIDGCADIPGRDGGSGFTGVALRAGDLETGIPKALDAGAELLILDASTGISRPWAELDGEFDLTVIREGIRILRALRSEEKIEITYFGGIRSGTDAAKLIAMGCSTVVLGASVGFALGAELRNGTFTFPSDRSSEELQSAAENFLKASSGEASMMARCTGKTNIHSLEPEDLRAITIPTAEDCGIPLIGT
jgi:NADPH-dependent glutamate synthase beta subunit-like oxidoreductase